MYKFKFADIGEGLHEGVVAEIYKKEGDSVSEGDSLFSVETDKVTSDIPSPATGKVVKVIMNEGDTIHVGDVVYHIDDGKGDSDSAEAVEEKPADDGAASVVGEVKVSNEMFSMDMFKKSGTAQKIESSRPVVKAAAAPVKAFDIASIKPTGSGTPVDVVVIGGGPAGYKAASISAKGGLKVVNIEKDKFGGTCVNIGCIPVKALIKLSKVVKTIQKASDWAIELDTSSMKLDMAAVNAKRWQISNTLAAGAESVVKASKAIVVKGEAKIIDKHNVEVNGTVYTTKVIIVATGAIPEVATYPGFEDGYKNGVVINSTQGLDIKAAPESLTIVGKMDKGGPTIDVNFAQILADLGVKVTLIKEAPAVANLLDSSVQKVALKSLEKAGVKVVLNAKIEKLDGKVLHYSVGSEKNTIESSAILAAVGRVPLDIGLDKVGVKLSERKGAIVNAQFQTSIDNIFAIGDIVDEYMLAHEGYRHGQVVAHYLLNKPTTYKKHLIPRTVYSIPEAVSVGYTEEELKAKGVEYLKGEWAQMYIGKSVADGETDGMSKILIGKKYGEILGMHMSNANAIEHISEATALMEIEATIEELAHTVHPHPSTGEGLWDASLIAYDAWQKANKK